MYSRLCLLKCSCYGTPVAPTLTASLYFNVYYLETNKCNFQLLSTRCTVFTFANITNNYWDINEHTEVLLVYVITVNTLHAQSGKVLQHLAVSSYCNPQNSLSGISRKACVIIVRLVYFQRALLCGVHVIKRIYHSQ